MLFQLFCNCSYCGDDVVAVSAVAGEGVGGGDLAEAGHHQTPVQYSTVYYSTVKYSKVQYSTVHTASRSCHRCGNVAASSPGPIPRRRGSGGS